MKTKLMIDAVCTHCRNLESGLGRCGIAGNPRAKWDEKKIWYVITCFNPKYESNSKK